jgi:hypothetical protein
VARLQPDQASQSHVDVVGDRLTARLNGTEVLRAATIVNPTGDIGLQGQTGTLDIRAIE